MNRISRFEDYKWESMAYEFIDAFDSKINESDKEHTNYRDLYAGIVSDLKLNFNLVSTFGAGIGAFYPIVSELMLNIGQSIDITKQSVVLATICAISIVYLEEKKIKDPKKEEELRKDAKSLLEELKMMGIGNGIIKKIVESLKSIKSIFFLVARHIGSVSGGFMDMFGYTAMLMPIMNAIYYMIDKYDLTPETLVQNFVGLSIGVGTVIAKRGISYLVNKIKTKFPINKKKVIDSIETPVIHKFGDISYGDAESDNTDSELIKEQ
jgi:hypothetical protein